MVVNCSGYRRQRTPHRRATRRRSRSSTRTGGASLRSEPRGVWSPACCRRHCAEVALQGCNRIRRACLREGARGKHVSLHRLSRIAESYREFAVPPAPLDRRGAGVLSKVPTTRLVVQTVVQTTHRRPLSGLCRGAVRQPERQVVEIKWTHSPDATRANPAVSPPTVRG